MNGILLSPLSIRLSIMPSPPLPLDDIQPIWCVSYSRKWGATAITVLAPPHGAGSRG